jgi:hypothetical protein
MQVTSNVDTAAARPAARPSVQPTQAGGPLTRVGEVLPGARDVPTVDASVPADSFSSNTFDRSAPGPSPQERAGLAELVLRVRAFSGSGSGELAGWVAAPTSGAGADPAGGTRSSSGGSSGGSQIEGAGSGALSPSARGVPLVPAHQMVALARVLFAE